ncbi:response regulator [Tengunoibacter tsumagoiensis]|uniref:Response regulatory domain-containing protein n=1 Tax=Tengunoibacter tsumagoiensis TaxID=2014871 RepID=A0A401ZYK2_9CHLR|nr:response regulator [Tengunoibacter tsumagoiensis]GCE11929.1 hypothetical protein KTT_17880 [Tengunoibacter tsumagoiensis]
MAKRILVVDDDKEIRDIVAFVLVRHGYMVEGAANGQQLQQHLAMQLPDLIILDVTMPGTDGYALLRKVRNHPSTSHIPVMIITGHVEDIYERISADLGAAYHLTKPFHPLELVEKVQTLMD